MKIISYLTWSVLLLTAQIVSADEAAVRKALAVAMPSLQVDAVRQSEVAGLYEVAMGASIVYVSEDGKYLLQGHLLDVQGRQDVTENKLAGARKTALDKLGEGNMIVFKAPQVKYKVTVFTDIDCGYCRKLHGEMEQYSAQGISVRYVFYPRAGKGSESYNKAVAVWCSDDRNKALTAAKKGQTPDNKTCDNPIDKHMQLAEEFGAQGTPMIVTEKGNIFPGYVPAAQLAKALAGE